MAQVKYLEVPDEDLILSSDGDEDEVGFAGPYAGKAREITEREKHIAELEKSPLTKFQKTVFDNKEKITWFEKNAKTCIALIVIVFIFFANIGRNMKHEESFSLS